MNRRTAFTVRTAAAAILTATTIMGPATATIADTGPEQKSRRAPVADMIRLDPADDLPCEVPAPVSPELRKNIPLQYDDLPKRTPRDCLDESGSEGPQVRRVAPSPTREPVKTVRPLAPVKTVEPEKRVKEVQPRKLVDASPPPGERPKRTVPTRDLPAPADSAPSRSKALPPAPETPETRSADEPEAALASDEEASSREIMMLVTPTPPIVPMVAELLAELRGKLFVGNLPSKEVELGKLTIEQGPIVPANGWNIMNVPGASAGGVGHQAADAFKAGPGCSIQCITSGRAYARGAGAKLVVTTDTPARIRIQVWDGQNYFRIVDSPDDDVYSFGALFDDLEQGTHYYAAAYAWDSKGHMSIADGSFETLTRNVKVTFSHANIIASPHDSPFTKDVWVEGQWRPEHSQSGLEPNGSLLSLGISIFDIAEVSQHLDLAVMLTQLDPGPDICQYWSKPDEPWVAQADCHTWAYATFASGDGDLDKRPANATSWVEHTIYRTLVHPSGGGALPPGYGYPLNFKVDVILDVTYE